MPRHAALLLSTALLFVASAASAETRRFYGYATDLKTGKYLYTEVHEQRVEDGRWLGGSIRYYAPDGHAIAEKSLDFAADPFIPKYRMSIPAEGYVEGISAVSEDSLTMEKTSHGKSATKTLARVPNMAADSGFHSTIVANFEELQTGKTIPFVFAVAGNLTSYKFRAKKTGDLSFDGVPAVSFVVEPDSFLRMLVDPLKLVYSADKKLLEYRGISNLHDPATTDAYNVRIVYPQKPPTDAPATLPPLQ